MNCALTVRLCVRRNFHVILLQAACDSRHIWCVGNFLSEFCKSCNNEVRQMSSEGFSLRVIYYEIKRNTPACLCMRASILDSSPIVRYRSNAYASRYVKTHIQ
ncbi:hypothetical protein GQX74_009319 [Glossina fuscipes]|nr:hypothetical protein GQX74_009319 [Glossina fuscipes]